MAALLKQEKLNMRINADELDLIRRGAETSGKSLSSFVIEAATFSAQKALMDQRFLHLDAELFDDLAETLSQPAQVHPELAALFKNEPTWATSKR